MFEHISKMKSKENNSQLYEIQDTKIKGVNIS